MRTETEIMEAFHAAMFAVRYRVKSKPPRIEVFKGEPPIFICAEPMMTLHLTVNVIDGEDVERRIAAQILGPVSRMTMAWHLDLTPEEAKLVKLTVEDAAEEMMAHTKDALSRSGMDTIADSSGVQSIKPTDPEWGR